MGYRFLDDYDPRKEQKKKQQQKGTQKAPPSGNPLNPAAQNNKNNKTNTPAATQPRTSKGTALGGSSVTPVQLPVQQITVPKLAKAATPMQTQTPQALTLKLPNIQAFGAGDYSKAGKAMDRIAKTVQAGAAQTASGFAEIAGQFRPTTGQQSMGQFSGFGDLGRAVRESREKGTDINTSILLQERQRRVQQKKSQQKIFDAATRLTERGQQYTQEAKQGLGTVGQFLVDMGVTGTQMAGDALANLILPGSGLVMMGMRSYGQAAGEARREGKSEGQQFLAGLKSAGIEVFTEKMFGAFSKIYSGAAADELVQKLVGKLTENATGQALLTWIVNAVGEGVEEVTSDLLNPLADRLLRLDDGKGPVWSTDDLAQWGYDFLLGTAMGMFGGGQQLVRGVQQGQAQTAENNYYTDLRRNGLGSANRAANAQRASDAMGRIMPTRDGLRMPRLVDEQGRTYEQRMAAEASGQRTATRYTAEEAAAKRKDARTFRNIIAGIDTSISDFFDRWKSGRKSHLGEKLEQLYIAPMPNNMAEDISKIVGYNVNGRDFIVTSDDVKHVMDQHGNPDVEIAKGNIPLETWMLDALPDVVTNPDSIEPGNLGTGNKNAGKRGIVFSKAFPGGKIITIQFDNKGRGTLELNTLYAKESAILEGNGTNAPNTFTPEAAKSALSYAEKTRMSRYTMPNTTESAVPVINVQSGPPQSFFSETSVPQGGTGVNTQGMQDGGEYAAAPAAPLQVPRLTTYEERQAEQRAERVANLVDNIDALHEAVDNGLRSPQLTTYEERARAKAEAEKASVRDRVRQMDAMTDAAAERAVEQRVQQEQQGREMPEALKKLGVAPFGSEADYAGIDNLAQEMQWNGSARKQTQRQMNKIPATEKERSFARKLADGTLDAADIPNTVNRETVETLADFYRTLDSAPETMLLRQRRATIMEREEAKMEPLLGMDVAYDEGGLRTNGKGDRKNSGRIAKTTSTLRRNLQTPARICATEWGDRARQEGL